MEAIAGGIFLSDAGWLFFSLDSRNDANKKFKLLIAYNIQYVRSLHGRIAIGRIFLVLSLQIQQKQRQEKPHGAIIADETMKKCFVHCKMIIDMMMT